MTAPPETTPITTARELAAAYPDIATIISIQGLFSIIGTEGREFAGLRTNLQATAEMLSVITSRPASSQIGTTRLNIPTAGGIGRMRVLNEDLAVATATEAILMTQRGVSFYGCYVGLSPLEQFQVPVQIQGEPEVFRLARLALAAR